MYPLRLGSKLCILSEVKNTKYKLIYINLKFLVNMIIYEPNEFSTYIHHVQS